MKLLLIAVNAKYIHSSLAVRYLRNYCRDLPCSIEISEFTINNHLLEIADQIFDKKPDIIGFDCYIWNIELIKKLLLLLNKLLPDTKIICGGPEVSYDTKSFMRNFPMVDFVIRGEGEQPLHSLLSSLLEDKLPDTIPGLAYRCSQTDEKIGFPVVFPDLNKLPFPYCEKDIAELGERIIYYESSRGCPYSCKYCLSCATKGVRYRAIDKVLAELSFFIAHDVKQVKFVDRTFNADKKHFMPIWEFLSKQNCRTNFHFEVAIDHLDEDALALLKQMPTGRIQLEAGIQSTNTNTLKQVSRVNNWSKITANIHTILSQKNIHIHTDLIIGLPYENMVSLHNSFNEAYALQPDMLQVGFLKLLKGSAMESLVTEHNYEFMPTAPYQVLSNNYLSADEMRFLRTFVEVFDLFYNSGRFRYTVRYLCKFTQNDAFIFFTALTRFWHKRQLDKTPHSPKLLYDYLADFVNIWQPVQRKTVNELLRFDALCSDGGRFKAEFLPWSEKKLHKTLENFWKNSVAVKKYIPDYKFINWRDIKTKYHVEYFTVDVLQFEQTGDIKSKTSPVLFLYTRPAVKKISIDPGDL
ncbi:B12-binding domain-containing radical SAM protein [Pectinatus frisingensis]|uniref:B12-binding domain-containing radical SAM protein n=1 Tax=Pectinatus frisingensis TaxID=865 RepID=UPI0018C843FC